jgi:dipeptidyl aminopeptidase/acylaminoacyl peptidase
MRRRAALPMRRLVAPLLCAALPLGLAMSAPADADVFGPISLVSASPFQQVQYAHDPAISGDGRYVVFDGSIGGVTGVWRREKRPGGELVQVAGGDAELPSISQNGRYVSFTTNEGGHLAHITDGMPDPRHETHEAPNVYVRDMDVEPGESGAFILASPLSYEYSSGTNREAEAERYGAKAAGRTALSADGQKVVFVTTAASNLDGPGTPPLQVAVHDLETGTTELVSVEDEPASGEPASEDGRAKPVPVTTEGTTVFGAVYTSGGPPYFESPAPYSLASGVAASISADGSTVAWMGQSLGRQVRGLAGEEFAAQYAEPLWRRIAHGEQAPTRRVTGGSDPSDSQCAAHPENSLPLTPSLSDPCQGPFATEGPKSVGLWHGVAADGYDVPQLSADGYTVAFLSTAPPVSLGSDFGLTPGEHGSDLYVADMHEGLSRVQALRTLTELASGDEAHKATNAPILDLAISPDGEQVAFTTKRTVFPLGSPAYVSAPAPVPGMSELFDVDLANDTLTRVTRGYEGGPSEHPHVEEEREDAYTKPDDGALSPSFTDGGEILAFSSTASNLVYGDGNTPPLRATLDGSDAFVVDRRLFGSTPTPQVISAAPANPSPTLLWSLGVTAVSLGDGAVRLYVEVPAAGTLRAEANSPVVVRRSSLLARRARRTARRSRAGTTVITRTVVTRTVATRTQLADALSGGVTTLLLTLAPRYRALASQQGGLSASANVTFSAPGHATLRQRIAVSFLHTTPARSSRSSQTAAARTRARRRKAR